MMKNIKLEDEQKEAIVQITKWIKEDRPITRVAGGAGTGKSLILTYLARIFQDFGVGAYTGKAASVLRSRGIGRSSTIHSMIYRPIKKPNGKVEFHLKSKQEIHDEFSGFFIDEGSMISRDIFEELSSFDLPVVYIGDHNQLEPIGSDINLMVEPDIKLEKIHRNAGEIAHFAHHLREGKNPWNFPAEKKVQVAWRKDVKDEHLKATDQIICAFNKTRVAMNDKVRRLHGRSGPLQVGDHIICLRNNRLLGLYNGQQGIAAKVGSKNQLVFQDEDGNDYEVTYDPKQFMAEKTSDDYNQEICLFDYSHLITTHKSQGSSFDNLIVYAQECSLWDMRRWNYTAASRAKHSIIWMI